MYNLKKFQVKTLGYEFERKETMGEVSVRGRKNDNNSAYILNEKNEDMTASKYWLRRRYIVNMRKNSARGIWKAPY